MLSINMIIESIMLDYKITIFGGKPCVYLHDANQYLDAADLVQWMRETRDDDPDLYAALVKIYFQLRKLPHPTDGNTK